MKTLTLLFALLFSVSVFADNACLEGGKYKMVGTEKVENTPEEFSACIALSEKEGCGGELKGCKCISGNTVESDGSGQAGAGDSSTRSGSTQ